MYKAAWIIAHTIFGLVTTVISLLIALKVYVSNLFVPTRPIEHDQIMIELSKTELIKIPKHIVIIFNDSAIHLESLSRLIRWIVLTGVRNISFYDYRGRFEDINPDVFKCAEKIHNELSTKLNQTDQNYGAIFNYVDATANTALISEVCRSACKSGVRPKEISITYLNKQIEDLMPDFPDPDLAIHFDEHCCTYGLSPWHIRLTEFAQVQLHSNFSLNSYLQILYKYSKCEQRFGK